MHQLYEGHPRELFFPLNLLVLRTFLILEPATYLKSSYKNHTVITNGRKKELDHYPLCLYKYGVSSCR